MASKNVSNYLQNRFMEDAKKAVKEAIARQEALGIKPAYIERAEKAGSFQQPAVTPHDETSAK